jgi:hypothetical protein
MDMSRNCSSLQKGGLRVSVHMAQMSSCTASAVQILAAVRRYSLQVSGLWLGAALHMFSQRPIALTALNTSI